MITMSAVGSIDGHSIYVLGGYDRVALNTVEQYQSNKNIWVKLPSMKNRRFMHASVIVQVPS